MALHGLICVNGTPIGAWTAIRVVTADPNVYDCDVHMLPTAQQGHERTGFKVEHRQEDGALTLAAKVLGHLTPPKPVEPSTAEVEAAALAMYQLGDEELPYLNLWDEISEALRDWYRLLAHAALLAARKVTPAQATTEGSQS